MFQCNRLDLTSSSTVASAKRYGNLSHTKKFMGTSFPPHCNPGHVTSTICRDNWLGFKSLWLGFRIRDCAQGVGSTFKLKGSVFTVRV